MLVRYAYSPASCPPLLIRLRVFLATANSDSREALRVRVALSSEPLSPSAVTSPPLELRHLIGRASTNMTPAFVRHNDYLLTEGCRQDSIQAGRDARRQIRSRSEGHRTRPQEAGGIPTGSRAFLGSG